jgi:addiction module RelB/DinJ family antitoxin
MSVQVSTRIDAATKQKFDSVCESIGISPSNALSMFIKGVINYKGIPFKIYAPDDEKLRGARERMREAFVTANEDSVTNGTDTMTMEEINAVIKESRQEKRAERA